VDDGRTRRIAAVVLAAGASTRFGSAKQLARIGGRTMLETVVETAREAGLSPVIAVVPPGLAVPPESVPEINDDPAAGISRSLRLGLAAVPPEADAAVILLGDEPMLSAETIRAVVDAAENEPWRVVAARADDRIGPPVLLPRASFQLADAVDGDHGLGRLLAADDATTVIDVPRASVDVDTPADLDAIAPACPGCGERIPAQEGAPTHEYIGASPGCWASFSELVAREFGDPGFGAVHRHTVDVYAVQHPGVDGRRQRQSVAVHLIALCQWLEHGMTAQQLNPMTQALASERRDWPWLDPPASYDMTVVDVLRATDGEEHRRLVRAWAASVWHAWSAHHERVRRWADEAGAR
jgi:CTP:molybdopterin cytidylyltransferase MocA